MKDTEESYPQNQNDRELFEKQRVEEKNEFKIDKTRLRMLKNIKTDNEAYDHLKFEVAENCLLPWLLEYEGQFKFITGLKFDTNGVSIEQTRENYIFDVPKVHFL